MRTTKKAYSPFPKGAYFPAMRRQTLNKQMGAMAPRAEKENKAAGGGGWRSRALPTEAPGAFQAEGEANTNTLAQECAWQFEGQLSPDTSRLCGWSSRSQGTEERDHI